MPLGNCWRDDLSLRITGDFPFSTDDQMDALQQLSQLKPASDRGKHVDSVWTVVEADRETMEDMCVKEQALAVLKGMAKAGLVDVTSSLTHIEPWCFDSWEELPYALPQHAIQVLAVTRIHLSAAAVASILTCLEGCASIHQCSVADAETVLQEIAATLLQSCDDANRLSDSNEPSSDLPAVPEECQLVLPMLMLQHIPSTGRARMGHSRISAAVLHHENAELRIQAIKALVALKEMGVSHFTAALKTLLQDERGMPSLDFVLQALLDDNDGFHPRLLALYLSSLWMSGHESEMGDNTAVQCFSETWPLVKQRVHRWKARACAWAIVSVRFQLPPDPVVHNVADLLLDSFPRQTAALTHLAKPDGGMVLNDGA